MRVIAGKLGGRTLRTLRGLALRPTSDRLRETLFDILGASVESSRWIDAFAGSGAVGIEALSRGAAQTIFPQKHRPAADLIRKNLAALGIDRDGIVIAATARIGLERTASRGYIPDFVFLDPPYEQKEEYESVLQFLDSGSLLASSGTVIAEHSRRNPLPEKLFRLARVRVVEQGDAALSFFRFMPAA
jgi:16S rRNA (guanine966-N2)-methyltransferase